MAVTNRLTVFCALLLLALLFGCAGMQSSGMDYEYNDGFVAYEYDAPLYQAYKASMHGAFREHITMDEVVWEPRPEITGNMNEVPVTIQLAETQSGVTRIAVKVTEEGNPEAAVAVHETIQQYLFW